ncbi:hypothetical protein CEXT_284171 [Caerostris extrusa]|uniref:Uncharacterized protein n=1 Tax=Caerostris extrusa TaxID=172846 RepID=A0AAV4NWU8_CAEEX|nr:hypothetical protein CEXT_284171 [Caerostris extrusa]
MNGHAYHTQIRDQTPVPPIRLAATTLLVDIVLCRTLSKERWKDALRMQYLLEDLWAAVESQSPPEDPFRRASLQVQCVHQELHAAGTSPETPSGAHGGRNHTSVKFARSDSAAPATSRLT